ncbi:monosaccharide ABC transporter ATP-binding protein, CUT2 family [Caenispirillum bisanense]|uniref:Monosaccharide ABC transporter ATP-binding protein, CUT2 family n=1 Tax=Caenispirillum bisanense TaxID=414052 RepID=A0A286GM33_9PROT|nr:monosaccharide ABC transporter ATP-binding protein, CUT2 family [Caenispirillum bisanense]
MAVAPLPTAPAPVAPGTASAAPVLSLRGIVKCFPGVRALDGVSLDVRPGEVHVLLGENGAGKSTLINVIAGTFAADAGDYLIDGMPAGALTPQRARALGICPVFQEFSLAPNLTVEDNLFLGREPRRLGFLDRRAMRAEARRIIADLGFDLDPARTVATLSRAHQQMAEIAKALLAEPRVLILDEPTASLTESETEKLFGLIERLRAEGVAIIYVSHRMPEIRRLGDRITVLRDGRHVRTLPMAGVTEEALVELMTGRKVEVLFPHIQHRPGEAALELRGLTTADRSVQGADFVARRGEITGIAGLVGCGKSELVRAAYGLCPLEGGEVRLFGETFRHPSPARALRQGLCYFPSDRVAEGLALERPIRENASMAALDEAAIARGGVLRRAGERGLIQRTVERLALRPAHIERPVGALSGGNRQKVVLARGLVRDTQVFLFDEPTVGIDVGAKADLYAVLKELAEGGAAIVLVSSELPEVLHLSNRVYVMHRSRMIAELSGADLTEQAILSCFFAETGDGRTGREGVAS